MVEKAYDFEIGSFSCQAPQDVSLYKFQKGNLDIFSKPKKALYIEVQ